MSMQKGIKLGNPAVKNVKAPRAGGKKSPRRRGRRPVGLGGKLSKEKKRKKESCAGAGKKFRSRGISRVKKGGWAANRFGHQHDGGPHPQCREKKTQPRGREWVVYQRCGESGSIGV